MDTVEIPFMLARDKYGKLIYEETMAKPLTALQNSGLSEDALNPDLNYAVGYQYSWIGGFGEYFYSPERPRRYLSSYGMDLSVEGAARLGPKWNSLAWPTSTAITLTDGALEDWATAQNLTSWTETTLGTSYCDRMTAAPAPHGGTYHAFLNGQDLATAYVQIAQSVSWSNDYRNHYVTASCYAYATNGLCTISIYDGVGTTSTTMSAGAAWTAQTVTRQLASNATELTISIKALYNDANPGRAYIDDVALAYATNTTADTHYAEYGGYQYKSKGKYLYKTDSATAPTAWTFVYEFSVDITDLYSAQVLGTSYLFICLGGSNATQSYNGTTFAVLGGDYDDGSYITSVGGAATDTYWKAETPNILRSNTFSTGLNKNWSTATYIGGTDNDVTDLLTLGSTLYIIKEDGIYTILSDGTIDYVAPDLKDFRCDGAGKNSCVKDGKVYVPMGTALIEYDPDAGTWQNISPSATVSQTNASQSNETLMYAAQEDFDGKIFAVTSLGNYLYCLQDNGTTNNLFKGINANIDGHTGWAWHPIAVTTMGDCTSLAASNLSGADWIWAGQGTGNPGYYDTTHYASTGYFVTPWFTGGVRHIQKSIYDVVCALTNVSAAHYYGTVYFQFYGDADWNATTLALNTTTVTGEISNYMPTNSYGRAVRFKILFQTDDADYSPKLNYIKANGKIRNTEIPVIQCSVVASDNGLLRTGVRDGIKAARKKTALDNAVASNWPVTFYNPIGTAMTIDMISRTQTGLTLNYQNAPSYTFDLVMQKVTVS
jgi:hypothetical protein